ncbi:MAG: MFS transporter, partial [Planctomycetota bacterium]
MEATRQYNAAFVWMICLVSAMGGLLFGYDWVVVGGARIFYEPYFHIETPEQDWWRGFTASSALYGCLVGAWVSGACTDRYGRKLPLLVSGVLFTSSAIWTALANDLVSFNMARVLGGIGIGLASNLSPLYIAEVSPAAKRGQFVSINQLTIVIGVLAAQIVNQLIGGGIETGATADTIREGWYGQTAWRWMFAAETIPALSFFALLFIIPESPRWLAKAGRWTQAQGVLQRVGTAEYAAAEEESIRRALGSESEQSQPGLGVLFSHPIRPLLVLGIVLAVFQQWCGINAIFYYAPE